MCSGDLERGEEALLVSREPALRIKQEVTFEVLIKQHKSHKRFIDLNMRGTHIPKLSNASTVRGVMGCGEGHELVWI